ncbi:uncharacterized protein LOC132928472 [Rhopalosiphum padi]|uniref:uncharacterized protein LOC132928472 n=1 Tax=Rhopalosiphum padi TaxID=40932 RepID=UPI00298D73EC|nr:uncharacterized protein LOC132928472 [Rhopalosiphum padi]XP_060849148.1 uncharacterized protein LOC132928472 [Rhopalosiphum padi]
MFNESELITHFDSIYNFAEVLALKSVREIEIPVCSSLIQLTSTDCLKLMKYELDKWSNHNELTMERILIFYLVTDYIGCGLSSPEFHTVFHKYLNTETSKIKLFKDLVKIWDNLFKNYKISNIDFVKNLIVGLERIFLKISILVPDDHIKFKCNKVMDKINYYIKEYEKNILVNDTLSNNSMQQLFTYDKNRVLGIENIVPTVSVKSEVNHSIQNLVQQNKQKKEVMEKSIEHNMTLNNLLQKTNIDLQKHNSETLIDNHFPKKPKLMSSDVLNRSTTTDPDITIVPHEQKKLNAFQIMMLNAKKQKTKLK